MGGWVFLSYSHADSRYLAKLIEHLHAEGIPVWADPQLERGKNWTRAIEHAIEGCAVLVPLMSAAARASEWVGIEIDYAKSLGKPIVPLTLDGTILTPIRLLQYEDVTDGQLPGDRFLSQLRPLLPDAPAVLTADSVVVEVDDELPARPPGYQRSLMLSAVEIADLTERERPAAEAILVAVGARWSVPEVVALVQIVRRAGRTDDAQTLVRGVARQSAASVVAAATALIDLGLTGFVDVLLVAVADRPADEVARVAARLAHGAPDRLAELLSAAGHRRSYDPPALADLARTLWRAGVHEATAMAVDEWAGPLGPGTCANLGDLLTRLGFAELGLRFHANAVSALARRSSAELAAEAAAMRGLGLSAAADDLIAAAEARCIDASDLIELLDALWANDLPGAATDTLAHAGTLAEPVVAGLAELLGRRGRQDEAAHLWRNFAGHLPIDELTHIVADHLRSARDREALELLGDAAGQRSLANLIDLARGLLAEAGAVATALLLHEVLAAGQEQIALAVLGDLAEDQTAGMLVELLAGLVHDGAAPAALIAAALPADPGVALAVVTGLRARYPQTTPPIGEILAVVSPELGFAIVAQLAGDLSRPVLDQVAVRPGWFDAALFLKAIAASPRRGAILIDLITLPSDEFLTVNPAWGRSAGAAVAGVPVEVIWSAWTAVPDEETRVRAVERLLRLRDLGAGEALRHVVHKLASANPFSVATCLRWLPEELRPAVVMAVVERDPAQVAAVLADCARLVAMLPLTPGDGLWARSGEPIIRRYQVAFGGGLEPFLLAARLAADPLTQPMVPVLLGERMLLPVEFAGNPIAMVAAEYFAGWRALTESLAGVSRQRFHLPSRTPIFYALDTVGLVVTDTQILIDAGYSTRGVDLDQLDTVDLATTFPDGVVVLFRRLATLVGEVKRLVGEAGATG